MNRSAVYSVRLENWRAFTLVELLVVIAIIGVLVGLLLPAVQAAREAARRMQCSNNLKQMGLALHNYESTYKKLPIGALWSRGALANPGWGMSWWVRILPFVELNNLADRLSMEGSHPGTLANTTPTWTGAAVNGPIVNGLLIPLMVCPSSPLQAVRSSGYAHTITCPQYTGIMGAVSDTGTTGFQNAAGRQWTHATANTISAIGGGLVIWDSVRFGDISDGLSNLMIVGEQSDFGRDATGARVTINNHQGFMCSMINVSFTGFTERVFNLTTLRYPPNSANIVLAGVRNNNGGNNGLFSAHPGGVQVVLADGSVHFISQTVNLLTLKKLATRDDGALVEEF